jgi:hypothetical protein
MVLASAVREAVFWARQSLVAAAQPSPPLSAAALRRFLMAVRLIFAPLRAPRRGHRIGRAHCRPSTWHGYGRCLNDRFVSHFE